MSQSQDLGLGGLSFQSTNDLSGTAVDVTNGNALGTTYKNGIGMAIIMDTTAGAVVIAGSNARILGVLRNNPKAGEAANVGCVRGASEKVLAGAAISVGDPLMTDSSGRFITAASSAQKICAIATEAATAAGNLIEAVLVDGYVA